MLKEILARFYWYELDMLIGLVLFYSGGVDNKGIRFSYFLDEADYNC